MNVIVHACRLHAGFESVFRFPDDSLYYTSIGLRRLPKVIYYVRIVFFYTVFSRKIGRYSTTPRLTRLLTLNSNENLSLSLSFFMYVYIYICVCVYERTASGDLSSMSDVKYAPVPPLYRAF